MTLVLLRDDDANATTDPAILARVYGPLLDEHLPVCFAVIPRVRLDTLDPDGRREGFLDPSTPSSADARPLLAGDPLAAWMRRHEADVDFFLHGLSHERVRADTELGALSRQEAAARLHEGRQILAAALDRVPLGFVAPWDAVSRGALQAVTAGFDLFSTGFVDRRRLPMSAWPAHARERVTRDGAVRVGRAWVLRHGGCRITGQTDPADVPGIVDTLCTGARVAVIVLHHWHFSGAEGHPVIRALAAAMRGRRLGRVRDALHELDG
jgi:hypothetical protein